MRFALIADVHANAEALEAVLEHARGQRVDRYVLLGDLVGYGADPARVVDLAMQLVDAGGIAVLGNHDAAVAERDGGSMNDEAMQAIDWTRQKLDATQRQFLFELPLLVQEECATFVHGSADRPQAWPYVTGPQSARASSSAAGTPYVFSGHVHDPALYYGARGGAMQRFSPPEDVVIPVSAQGDWLAVVGSVGQPRDNRIGARYALFDDVAATLTFFRLPYDYPAAARKIREAGLPESFALRIEGLD